MLTGQGAGIDSAESDVGQLGLLEAVPIRLLGAAGERPLLVQIEDLLELWKRIFDRQPSSRAYSKYVTPAE